MAEVNSTATGSPCGKVSVGGDPARVSGVGICAKPTPSIHGDIGARAGRTDALANQALDEHRSRVD